MQQITATVEHPLPGHRQVSRHLLHSIRIRGQGKTGHADLSPANPLEHQHLEGQPSNWPAWNWKNDTKKLVFGGRMHHSPSLETLMIMESQIIVAIVGELAAPLRTGARIFCEQE